LTQLRLGLHAHRISAIIMPCAACSTSSHTATVTSCQQHNNTLFDAHDFHMPCLCCCVALRCVVLRSFEVFCMITTRYPAAAAVQVGVPLSLRTLPSTGMLVVQGPQFSQDAVCARIATMVAPAASQTADRSQPKPVDVNATAAASSNAAPVQQPSSTEVDKAGKSQGAAAAASQLNCLQQQLGAAISASDVALALGCSTSLAAELLVLAEGAGVVCRDEGPEGLRFFRNFFADPHLLASVH
jgi:hypothetical protein